MRMMMLSMISSSSLSAFSASLTQGGINPAAGTGGVTRVRAAGMQPSQPQAAAPATRLPQADPGAPQPSRTLPRGSLLDLSV